jgi:hypothetical protein
MNRWAAVPILGLVLVSACEDSTAPNRLPEIAGPALQQSPPGPSEVQCSGPLPPGTYPNITVVPNTTCDVRNSTVLGNIKVLDGGRLDAFNNQIAGSIQLLRETRLVAVDNAVNGAVQSTGGTGFFLIRGSVGGGISVVERRGVPVFIDVDIQQVQVKGDVTLSRNFGWILVANNVLSNGNITISENVIPAGAVARIDNNTVPGNIHVIKNSGGELQVNGNIIPNLVQPTIPGAGNVKVEDNVIPAPHRLFVQFNRTYQNVQVFKNTGTGTKFVNGNNASESVQCWENTQPFFGNPNTAPKLEGQCGVPPTTF